MIKDEFSKIKGRHKRFMLRRKKLGLCRLKSCTKKAVAYERCAEHAEQERERIWKFYGHKTKYKNTKLSKIVAARNAISPADVL